MRNANNRVLLISNSTLYGSGYLDHAAAEICDFLGSAKNVLSDPNSTHMGETQEERILQFLKENDTTVAGLREGAMVRVENGSTTLKDRLAHESSAKVWSR